MEASLLICLSSLLLCGLSSAQPSLNLTTEYKYSYVTQNLPARKQWGTNAGYCGETSTVAALLKFGAYYSQYDIRDISVLFAPQTPAGESQQQRWYSVGTNDQIASEKLSLEWVEYDSYNRKKTTQDYYVWLKDMTRKGHAVTFCVYMNHNKFYGIDDPEYGFHFYDHIVSVAKIESNFDDDEYHPDDRITFSDHGVWSPENNPPFYFSYTFDEFRANRTQANSPEGNIYSMPDDVLTTSWKFRMLNFGIAHTGPTDDDASLLPLLVQTNVNYERPEPLPKSNKRPKAMPLVLTVTVSGLERGVSYVLMKFDDETKVPSAKFIQRGLPLAAKTWTFVGENPAEHFQITDDIMSNDKAIYRCVRADAP